jgi:hypothetical protein
MSEYMQAANIEVAPMHGETVLFNPDTNKFCLLNRTAAFVWTQLPKAASAEALAREICNAYEGADPSAVRKDVEDVISHMQSMKFVVPKN